MSVNQLRKVTHLKLVNHEKAGIQKFKVDRWIEANHAYVVITNYETPIIVECIGNI